MGMQHLAAHKRLDRVSCRARRAGGQARRGDYTGIASRGSMWRCPRFEMVSRIVASARFVFGSASLGQALREIAHDETGLSPRSFPSTFTIASYSSATLWPSSEHR